MTSSPEHAFCERLCAPIANAVAALERLQRDGQFPNERAPTVDMVGAEVLPRCVYPTTFVVHALCALPKTPAVTPMLADATRFLLDQQEDSGAWHYLGRGATDYPTDMDDTSCVIAALAQMGRPMLTTFAGFLTDTCALPEGPYYTWIHAAARGRPDLAHELDALVNANVLHAASVLGLQLPGVARFLAELAGRGDFATLNHYAEDPHLLVYCVSRACPDALAAAFPHIRRFIAHSMSKPAEEPSALRLALFAASLGYVSPSEQDAAPLLEELLRRQHTDGTWPAWAANDGIRLPGYIRYDGSRSMTTAIAIDALRLALQRHGAVGARLLREVLV